MALNSLSKIVCISLWQLRECVTNPAGPEITLLSVKHSFPKNKIEVCYYLSGALIIEFIS